MSSAPQHFCRVCNTQLNSCKQARIHVAGKKHEKRLAYLKIQAWRPVRPSPGPTLTPCPSLWASLCPGRPP
eukprot:UN15992